MLVRCPQLGCLATYVDYMPYVSLSRLGGGIDPTIIDYWDYSTYILPEIT